MRLPDRDHWSQPWRIHAIAPDFRVEDVWALPGPVAPDDLPRLVELLTGYDPDRAASGPVRGLFAVRRLLGELFGWDDPAAADETLADRLPADLRAGPLQPASGDFPARPLFQTSEEWAAEIVNRTVHGVLHLGMVPTADGARAQLAILVKPRGALGSAYLAAIRPFRRWVVYPAITRELGRRWAACQRQDGTARPRSS